jgi:hypothetical protein
VEVPRKAGHWGSFVSSMACRQRQTQDPRDNVRVLVEHFAKFSYPEHNHRVWVIRPDGSICVEGGL